jgi:hypothetical protein
MVKTAHSAVEQLTGIPKQGLGPVLAPIQAYRKRHDLPPLTSIVIKETTGLPGTGFTEALDIFGAQARVFVFDWLSRKAPTAQELANSKVD